MMVQKKELIKNSLIFFIGYFFSYVLTNYFFANSPYMIISSCSILTVFLVVIIFYLLKFNIQNLREPVNILASF